MPCRTATSTSLLDALGDAGNDGIWSEFDARYRPVMARLARRMGLDEAEADDAVQESLLEFVRDFRAGRYERGRGRLHSWLLAIVRNRVRDALERRWRRGEQRGDSILGQLGDPGMAELERVWEAELEAELLRRAFDLLRRASELEPGTIAIFEDYAVRELGAEEVARRHAVPPSAVYVAKSRCLKRLRELREELRAAFEDG